MTHSYNHWFTATVIKGSKLGRTIGYPTINLNNPHLLKGKKEGVYLSEVLIEGKKYYGMLYLGTRLVARETKSILEINVFDFDREIYGKEISFQLLDYIREVMNIPTFDELKKQLQKDFLDAKSKIPAKIS